MLVNLSSFVIKMAREARTESRSDKPKPKTNPIDLEWIDSTLQNLFKNRENKDLDSRIRF